MRAVLDLQSRDWWMLSADHLISLGVLVFLWGHLHGPSFLMSTLKVTAQRYARVM